MRAKDVTTGTEDCELFFRLIDGGAQNDAVRILGSGQLSVDADSGLGAAVVGKFDEYDDALILRQGISEGALEKLEDIGIMTRKDTGSGWFLNLQGMSYLLAGGIYQNRAKIDDLEERLVRMGG